MSLQLVEVKAYSKKEAIELAKEQGFTLTVGHDATTAYKTATAECVTAFDINAFAQQQIDKKGRGVPVGFITVVDAGKEETKTRLYKVENITVIAPRHYTLSYELVTESGVILGSAPLKDGAVELAKPLVNSRRETINIRLVKTPDTQPIGAIVKYDPSPDTKLGTYILFGQDQ